MKKLVSILTLVCMLLSSIPVLAETFIELDELRYTEYMFGETVVVRGSTNAYVSIGLYLPEETGGTSKFIMSYSPDELGEGVGITLGEKALDWPEGEWKIIVQSGDAREELYFTLAETVDRTEPDDGETSDKPDKPTRPNTGDITVTSIIPDKTEISLEVGQSETVTIATSVSSLSVEIEDEDVISASISGKTLTITALKRGTSAVWVKAASNYASISVSVKNKSYEAETEKPTEKPTEQETENETETEETKNPFRDLSDKHWAAESILSLYSKGIVTGMSETLFNPNGQVTRAQFITMLTRAFNLKSSAAESPFNDVNETSWYFASVMAAFENGVTTGDNLGNFNPNSNITRQDMATLIYRVAVNSGMELTSTGADMSQFADDELISSYAKDAVYTMRSIGVINGKNNNLFDPLGMATRAEAAHIIARLLALN